MSVLLVISGTSCPFTFIFPHVYALHGSACYFECSGFPNILVVPSHIPVLPPLTFLMFVSKEQSKLFSSALSSQSNPFNTNDFKRPE